MKYLIDQQRISYELEISELKRKCNDQVMLLRLELAKEQLNTQRKLMDLQIECAVAKKEIELLKA